MTNRRNYEPDFILCARCQRSIEREDAKYIIDGTCLIPVCDECYDIEPTHEFNVLVTVKNTSTVTVWARTGEEAIGMVHRMWEDGKVYVDETTTSFDL